MDLESLPRDVRDWWSAQLRRPAEAIPTAKLLAQARSIWPERDCGRDAVTVMYSAVYTPTVRVAA